MPSAHGPDPRPPCRLAACGASHGSLALSIAFCTAARRTPCSRSVPIRTALVNSWSHSNPLPHPAVVRYRHTPASWCQWWSSLRDGPGRRAVYWDAPPQLHGNWEINSGPVILGCWVVFPSSPGRLCSSQGLFPSPSPTGTEASPPEGVPAPTEEEQGAPPLSPAGAASAPRRSRRGAVPVEDYTRSFLPCFFY